MMSQIFRLSASFLRFSNPGQFHNRPEIACNIPTNRMLTGGDD